MTNWSWKAVQLSRSWGQ